MNQVNNNVLLKIQGFLVVIGGLLFVALGSLLLFTHYAYRPYDDLQLYYRDTFIFWVTNIFLAVFLVVCISSAHFGIKQKHLSQYIVIGVTLFQVAGMFFALAVTHLLQDKFSLAIFSFHVIINGVALMISAKMTFSKNNSLYTHDA